MQITLINFAQDHQPDEAITQMVTTLQKYNLVSSVDYLFDDSGRDREILITAQEKNNGRYGKQIDFFEDLAMHTNDICVSCLSMGKLRTLTHRTASKDYVLNTQGIVHQPVIAEGEKAREDVRSAMITHDLQLAWPQFWRPSKDGSDELEYIKEPVPFCGMMV